MATANIMSNRRAALNSAASTSSARSGKKTKNKKNEKKGKEEEEILTYYINICIYIILGAKSSKDTTRDTQIKHITPADIEGFDSNYFRT